MLWAYMFKNPAPRKKAMLQPSMVFSWQLWKRFPGHTEDPPTGRRSWGFVCGGKGSGGDPMRGWGGEDQRRTCWTAFCCLFSCFTPRYPEVSASFWEMSTAVDGCELFPKQAAHVDIESFIDQVTLISGQVICLRTTTSATLGSKNCDEIGVHLNLMNMDPPSFETTWGFMPFAPWRFTSTTSDHRRWCWKTNGEKKPWGVWWSSW